MSAFTEEELRYLTGERRLARLATVGKDTTPHVTPVGWIYNAELGTKLGRRCNLLTSLCGCGPIQHRGAAKGESSPLAQCPVHPLGGVPAH